MDMERYFIDPRDHGAVGDGEHDDTQAIRTAVARALEGCGNVRFSPGVYRTDCITVPMGVSLTATPSWSYSYRGRTVLVPLRADQECVLEVSDALGTTLEGICIDGLDLGECIHGVSMCRERHTTRGEHSLRIENFQVRSCTGNGYNMVGAWAVCMRRSQAIGNRGYGFYLDGCDAFIVDNWFSGNGKAGFGGDTWNSAVNFTSNRVEWNRECGVSLRGGMRYNLTGNYFDRTFGPALVIEQAPNFHKRLHKEHTVMPYAITVTGNTFVRSGALAEPGSDRDCQIYMCGAAGVSICGNTFNVWKDDGRNGRISPMYGIILRSCAHCVITGNAMAAGALKELIRDQGDHGEGMVIENNTGVPVPESAWSCQDPFTPIHFLMEGGLPWYSEKLEGERNE